jgi:hypothetical protein
VSIALPIEDLVRVDIALLVEVPFLELAFRLAKHQLRGKMEVSIDLKTKYSVSDLQRATTTISATSEEIQCFILRVSFDYALRDTEEGRV